MFITREGNLKQHSVCSQRYTELDLQYIFPLCYTKCEK